MFPGFKDTLLSDLIATLVVRVIPCSTFKYREKVLTE